VIPAFTLREAQRGDEHALHAMVRELADYEKLTHLVSGTADDLARELFAGRPVIEALIVHVGDAPAGFALYFHNYSTFLARRGLYLEDVYVKPAYRRRGIGRALLVKLAQIAVMRGCGRFEWSVLDWNEPAIRFYEGLGATVMPEWRIVRVTGDALRVLAAKPKS
jgi:ribosomal protein S18 acetylase RimI-like enzyme